MRYLLIALILTIGIAAAAILAPRELRRPVLRGGYPPAPTAVEESGMPEAHVAQVLPPTPKPHRRVQPPGLSVTRRTSAHATPPSLSVPPQGGGSTVASSPSAQIGDDAARSPVGPRPARDPDQLARLPSPDSRQEANVPAAQPSLPQADTAVRAPVVSPPVLLTPVAGYPTEGYRIALDRTMLTPRLRVEAAQGRVMLKVLVRADGSVGSVEVTESSGIPALDQAAVRQAGAWVFAPATRDGQPIEAWALISVWFVVP